MSIFLIFLNYLGCLSNLLETTHYLNNKVFCLNTALTPNILFCYAYSFFTLALLRVNAIMNSFHLLKKITCLFQTYTLRLFSLQSIFE